MKKLFYEVNSLDKRCYEEFYLSEEILMEHAANSIKEYIQNKFEQDSSILIVCGAGNNGADGITLSRLLHKRFDVKLFLISNPKSSIAQSQYKRAKSLGVKEISELFEADIIVDCIFGTGLNKKLSQKYIDILDKLNSFNSFKISCDIPSGINSLGQVEDKAFKSDTTITMGALKTSLYSDMAKDFVGQIKVANLGLQRELYETNTNTYLLEKSDIKLPYRKQSNTHKGTFGHLNIILGEKKGAALISSLAGFSFGAGLVSVISDKNIQLPYHIMQSNKVSQNCTAIAIGMGLGNIEQQELKSILCLDIPRVIDADLFYNKTIIEYFDEKTVLTPHPKEFVSLLKLCDIADISIEELQNNRLKYAKQFCQAYPKVVLLLKGANVIICQDEKTFINPLGTSVLAKGGSGDVLSGLIGALLAQGYDSLQACISASLAHSIASNNFDKNSYSLTPQELIDEIKVL